MSETPLAPVEPLLIAEVRQFRKSWTTGALSLAGTLWIIVMIGVVSLPRKDAIEIGSFAASLGAPTVALLWVAGRRDPARHRALRALRERARTVVWLYTRLRHGSTRLDEIVFNFEDGSIESIPVDPERSRDLLARVAAFLPRASVGFSPEAADAFMRAPASLYRETPQAIGRESPPLETSWLLPYARATYRLRRFGGGLGVLLALLGILGVVIVGAAASPRDQPALLIGVFTVAAVLPGVLLMRYGFARFDRGELAAALRAPSGRVRSVEITHQANVEGDHVDVAVVTLTTGRTFVFWVAPKARPNTKG